MAYVALREKLSDSARGDGLASKAAWGVDANFEVQFAAKGFEAFDVGLGLISETEVFTFVKFGYMKGLLQDFGDEGTGGFAREVVGKGKDEESVEACGFEEFKFLCEGRYKRPG